MGRSSAPVPCSSVRSLPRDDTGRLTSDRRSAANERRELRRVHHFGGGGGIGVSWMVPENRTRTSQKSINAKGANARTNSIGEPCSSNGRTRCCPRKNEPVGMKKAKHIR